ncbi:THUMP domain-containing protein 1 [Blastocladiella emersonii ATCC 22665]|nr:THUMP domain-containing protein 1 [Blastocladiella emersonii ATCC 22665]
MSSKPEQKQQQQQNKKRPAGGDDSGRGGKRQRHSPASMEPGMVGFFVSSTKGRERVASKEVTSVLAEAIEELYPEAVKAATGGSSADAEEKKPESTGGAPKSIEDEIASEVQALADNKHGNFQSSLLAHIGMGVDCLFFLQVVPASLAAVVDPVAVLNHVFGGAVASMAKAEGGKKSAMAGARTRYAHRILPFQGVCAAEVTGIVDRVTALVAQTQPPVAEGQTFALAVKIRVGSSLDRTEVIEAVAAVLHARGLKVNLERADVSVLVEAYRNRVGVAVVPEGKYTQYRKFNLHEVYAKGEDLAEAPAAAAAGIEEKA